ncbi:MAG: AraC family transcriptional regulator [bacterium]
MEHRDPLADVLEMLRVRGSVMAHVRAHAPWGLRIPRAPGATFHAVTSGSCWVRVPGAAPQELHPGDVVLLPAGAGHIVGSDVNGPAKAWDRVAKAKARSVAGEILIDGPGTSAHFICASYDYDREVAHPLLSLLPPLLFVSADQTPQDGAVHGALRLLRQELAARSAGWETVTDRLIDILFVHVIRAWIDRQHDRGASWLLALRDPIIARALAALHAEPSKEWTVETLAEAVNLSRATLTRRFTSLVGVAPLAYLTRWRIDLAAHDLRDTDDAVSAIAHRVGYTSEFAFSRAFSRVRGRPPGRFRIEARERATQVQPRPRLDP